MANVFANLARTHKTIYHSSIQEYLNSARQLLPKK